MKRPLVSVVVPAYDSVGTIGQLVRTILEGSPSAIEVIVVDDASPEEIRCAVPGDPRVNVIRHETNRGQAAARNHAVDIARGEWIAITDDDDSWRPHRLEHLVRIARQSDSAVSSDDQLIFRPGSVRPATTLLAARGLPQSEGQLTAEALVRHELGFLKPIFHRSIFESGLRWDEQLRWTDDFDFALRVLLNGWRWQQSGASYYEYRLRSGSASMRQVALQHEVLDHTARALATWRLDPGVRRAMASRAKHARDAIAWAEFRETLASRGLARATVATISNRASAPRVLREAMRLTRRRIRVTTTASGRTT